MKRRGRRGRRDMERRRGHEDAQQRERADRASAKEAAQRSSAQCGKRQLTQTNSRRAWLSACAWGSARGRGVAVPAANGSRERWTRAVGASGGGEWWGRVVGAGEGDCERPNDAMCLRFGEDFGI